MVRVLIHCDPWPTLRPQAPHRGWFAGAARAERDAGDDPRITTALGEEDYRGAPPTSGRTRSQERRSQAMVAGTGRAVPVLPAPAPPLQLAGGFASPSTWPLSGPGAIAPNEPIASIEADDRSRPGR
jgi:hypothetical protein